MKTKGTDLAWLRFKWNGSSVEMRITGKPTGASVAVDENLSDAGLVEPRRAQWSGPGGVETVSGELNLEG